MCEYKIVLASGSPRRRDLMDLVGAKYIVIPSDKEEDMSGHDPAKMVEGLSSMKAMDVVTKVQNKIFDTTSIFRRLLFESSMF